MTDGGLTFWLPRCSSKPNINNQRLEEAQILSTKNEILRQAQSVTQLEKVPDGNHTGAVRKPFVEPEVSVPVDVLEATTFFQSATSGATN